MSALHQHMLTKQWWETERTEFVICASAFTEQELTSGEYPGQREAVKLVRRLRYIPFTSAVRRCAERLLEDHVVPETKAGDATQLAFATIHNIDYLLTWNYAHLVNVHVQRKLTALCLANQWREPILVSPETIPRVALGQTIRREDDD